MLNDHGSIAQIVRIGGDNAACPLNLTHPACLIADVFPADAVEAGFHTHIAIGVEVKLIHRSVLVFNGDELLFLII